jgi:hypothetical protein
MRVEDFQNKLRTALGSSLENATPANVREFVDQTNKEIWRETHPLPSSAAGGRIDIRSTPLVSYEAVIQNYFARALSMDRDQSLIQLWLLALDLAYSGIEELHAEKLNRLFNSEQ